MVKVKVEIDVDMRTSADCRLHRNINHAFGIATMTTKEC